MKYAVIRNMVPFLLWLVVGSLPPSFAQARRELSYADLTGRLVDLESLSLLPEPGEKCAQWSSYHRASRYDTESGKYAAWDQNGDNVWTIRQEDGMSVLAEMEGPGCIWRIWSASPGSGRVKIYLDGARSPAVDLPFRDYFSGTEAPFHFPALTYKVAAGSNSFVPIPYRRSCKIVAEKDWGAFYHFTYGTFPSGTKVPTFRRDLSGADLQALARVNGILGSGLGSDPARRARAGQRTTARQMRIQGGQSAEPLRIEGARAITALRVKLAGGRPLEETVALLRSVVLKIRWDGEKESSVWAPLGDFFGTAPGISLYRSLPLGMTREGLYSYWYMPFARSATLELSNEGTRPFGAEISVDHAPLAQPPGRYARFHAKWHRDAFAPPEPERAIDWTLLTTKGRGRFCGVMLHVWNPKGTWKGEWWGEGDEKFFVDGEKFPSTFGTGTEDYFGYAWSFAELFQRAFHNQTFNRFDNRGHVSVNRWQIADNVPFQKSFDGYLEKYFPNNLPALYACTAYWYLDPDGKDPYGPVPVGERTGYWDYILPSVGKTEARFGMAALHTAEKTGGTVAWADGIQGPRGRARRYYRWSAAQAGDRLEIDLPLLQEGGTYAPRLTLLRGPGFGRVQLYLDGERLGDALGLGQEAMALTEEIRLEPRRLGAGAHRLTVEMLDAPPGGGTFGIDTIHLEWISPEK